MNNSIDGNNNDELIDSNKITLAEKGEENQDLSCSKKRKRKYIYETINEISSKIQVIILYVGMSLVGIDVVGGGIVRQKVAEILIEYNKQGIINFLIDADFINLRMIDKIPLKSYIDGGDDLYISGFLMKIFTHEELNNYYLDFIKKDLDISMSLLISTGILQESKISKEFVNQLIERSMLLSLTQLYLKGEISEKISFINIKLGFSRGTYNEEDILSILNSGLFTKEQLRDIDFNDILYKKYYSVLDFLLSNNIYTPTDLSLSDLENIQENDNIFFNRIISKFYINSDSNRNNYFTKDIYNLMGDDFFIRNAILTGEMKVSYEKTFQFTYLKVNKYYPNTRVLVFLLQKGYIDNNNIEWLLKRMEEVSLEIEKEQDLKDIKLGQKYLLHIEKDWETTVDIIDTIDMFSGIKKHLLENLIEEGAERGLRRKLTKEQLTNIMEVIGVLGSIITFLIFLSTKKD